jgi:hypothetical protein
MEVMDAVKTLRCNVEMGNAAVEAKDEKIRKDEGFMCEDGSTGMEIPCSYMDKSTAQSLKHINLLYRR